MNASPPILQIHLLLNVLNRFAFIPGLGEREQAGIECLGDYLVAVHRLQSPVPTSAGDALASTVRTLLRLNQWLREDASPVVSVRCADGAEERLAAMLVPLAARLQAALMRLDGQAIRAVEIGLAPGGAESPGAIRVKLEVSFASAMVFAVASGDGVPWVDADPLETPGRSLVAEFDQPPPASQADSGSPC